METFDHNFLCVCVGLIIDKYWFDSWNTDTIQRSIYLKTGKYYKYLSYNQ